jgi:L-alanine-DL-glutamate epimerase-like enolase superfamily enzyme
MVADEAVRCVADGYRAVKLRLGWLEEPFPPYRDREYRAAERIAQMPLAAGENCYTRYDFGRLIEEGAVSVLQPDPLLASIDSARYFEGDGSTDNPLRSQLCSAAYELGADGTVRPLEGNGLGVEIDEDFLRAHPITEGPAWR